MTNSIAALVSFGLFFVTAQYLQLVLGLRQLEAGLWTIPSALAVIVSGMAIAPALISRLPRNAVVAAMLTALALALVTGRLLGDPSLEPADDGVPVAHDPLTDALHA